MVEIKMFAVAVLNIYTICNNWKFLHIKSEDLCFAPAKGKGKKKVHLLVLSTTSSSCGVRCGGKLSGRLFSRSKINFHPHSFLFSFHKAI